MEMMLNKIVPEGLPYRHSCEGPDDMVSLASFQFHPKLTAVSRSLPAGAREGLLPGQLADDPDHGRQAVAGHVAGRVAVRAPRPRGQPEASDHAVGVSARFRPQSPVARVPDRVHLQLGTAPLRPGQSLGAAVRG